MTRELRLAAIRAVGPATVALLVVAAMAPGRLELAVRIYALVVAVAVIVLALLALRRAFPDETQLQDTRRRRHGSRQPESLARARNEVALGVASSFDLHYRLVPRLRATAAGLLASRRNVSLETRPDVARALLGEETWDLVRPDRPAPEDRLASGIERGRLAHVVGALEKI